MEQGVKYLFLFKMSCDGPLHLLVASFSQSSQKTSTVDHLHAMIITVITSVTITANDYILVVTE